MFYRISIRLAVMFLIGLDGACLLSLPSASATNCNLARGPEVDLCSGTNVSLICGPGCSGGPNPVTQPAKTWLGTKTHGTVPGNFPITWNHPNCYTTQQCIRTDYTSELCSESNFCAANPCCNCYMHGGGAVINNAVPDASEGVCSEG